MNDETKQAIGEKIEETVKAAEETVRHPFVKKLARFGFYTKGFLFLVIGVLAILVATDQQGGELADPTGAMTLVAQAPLGKVFLIIFIVGAIGHGGWNILRGAADVDDAGKNWRGIIRRSIAAGIGFFYLFLAWTAWQIVLTARVQVQNGAIQKTLTTVILALPLGVVFIFLLGVVVMGVGVHECYSGVTGKFKENFRVYEIEGNSRKIITVLGVLGFTARAVIYGLIGYFFVMAAIQFNPNEVIGVDGALLALAQTYYGKALLFIAAIGLISHGVLSLYEARYRRIC